jgi:hypothetical protein
VRYSVRYKPPAAAEVANAIASYSQPEVSQAEAFVRDLERTETHLTAHPESSSCRKPRFFASAYSEPTLIRLAYAFEQKPKARKTPQYLPSAALD